MAKLLTYPLLATTFNIYYLVRQGPKNEKINAFPKGLKVGLRTPRVICRTES